MGRMTQLRAHQPAPHPLVLIGQAVRYLSRDDLAALATRLIDRLDELEPDADLEPDEDACTARDDYGGAPFPRRFRECHWTGEDDDDEFSIQPATL